jgi:pimeloyl-ACP methyl ester carboxylesterase
MRTVAPETRRDTSARMQTVDEWRAAGSYFDWQGHRVFCRVEGAGDVLLLIHGFPTASWDWSALWPALVQRYRVITLDMIGFGLSAKPRHFAYSVMAQADLVGAFLVREKVTRYRMVAHDMGDSVAQELFARQRGDAAARIVAACLLNGGIFPEVHRPAVMQRLLASAVGPVVARFSSYRLFARTMRGIWGKQPPAETELKAMWQLVKESDGTAVLPKLLGYLAERRQNRDRWVGAIVNPPAPVRFINGLLDPIAGEATMARYRELVPEPDVVELADVGHYPQVEAPEAVLAAVLAHFDAH